MFGVRIYIYLAVFAIISAIVAGAWFYYNDTQNRLQEQASILATQEIAIAQANAIIAQKDADIKKQASITKRIEKKFSDSRQQVERLQAKFNKLSASGVKRDIGQLAISNPKAIERIITAGSNEAMRCVEIASGAPLTEQEKKATKRSQINDSCPALANPSYIPH